MSVKAIFITLVGTIMIVVIGALIVEVYNMQMTALQINQLTNMAAKKACELYAQETYKERDDSGGGLRPMQNIVYDSTGTGSAVLYLSGEFYPSSDPHVVYNTLYKSTDFTDWINSAPIQAGGWNSLMLLHESLNRVGAATTTEELIGDSYVDVMMTPLNMGVPYLDNDVLEQMFRWNLTNLASDFNYNLIREDDSGMPYVNFKGFRLYTAEATIANLEYRTFDLNDPGDAAEFRLFTNIEPSNLTIEFDDIGLQTLYGDSYTDDERNRVCVVGVTYRIPIAFEGITPIRNIYNYATHNETSGFNGEYVGSSLSRAFWQDDVEIYESGGFEGSSTTVNTPTPGRLVYFVVR